MKVARKRKSRTSLNFTFYLNTLYLVSILFTRLKFKCVNVRSQKGVMDFHCRVIFPCVNKIETLYGRSRKYVKIEPRSTFTFTRGLSYIAYISFTHVNFTYFLTEKLRNSGNQP